MTHEQLNQLLRQAVNSVFQKFSAIHGIKTRIANILVGSTRMIAFTKWFNNQSNFGVKPLSRIAEAIGKELLLVMIDPNDPLKNEIISRNIESANLLRELLAQRLENWEVERKISASVEKIKSKIDELFVNIDDLPDDDILEE